MRLLIAPDSFKGTFTAGQVAEALAAGVATAGHQPVPVPLADGGEGTAATLARAGQASWVPCTATGPLGSPVAAGFHRTADGVALLDTAAASGLTLVPEPSPRTAWEATSRGTGELIAAAVAHGARHVVLGVGGSATTDGGAGAVAALRAAGGLRGARLTVLCDVTTSYLDAAAVFAAQKGADPDTVARLTSRLDELAGQWPRDPRDVPWSGCAGGLSGGLWAAFDAEIVPGARYVLAAVGFTRLATGADAIITGEGRFDRQSLLGKLVTAVRESAAGRPVHLVAGATSLSQQEAIEAGFASLTVASTRLALREAGAALARRIATTGS